MQPDEMFLTRRHFLPQIPHEMVTQSRNSYVEAELQAPTIEELCKQEHQDEDGEDEGTCPAFMEARLQGLLKEAREKAKGWVSCQSTGNTELSYKKVRTPHDTGLTSASMLQHV